MNYTPHPLDISQINLPADLEPFIEQLAANTHEVWAAGRLADGWVYGAKRDDLQKQHPGLIPYADLSESEKDYDRHTTQSVIKAMILLGAKISFPQAKKEK